jgi:hypothetical protein
MKMKKTRWRRAVEWFHRHVWMHPNSYTICCAWVAGYEAAIRDTRKVRVEKCASSL